MYFSGNGRVESYVSGLPHPNYRQASVTVTNGLRIETSAKYI